MTQKQHTLGEVAQYLGAELRGDDTVKINSLATLKSAGPGQISFLANAKYASLLAETGASAVLVSPEMSESCPTNVLLLDNPYLGYARLSHWFDPAPSPDPGVHPSASVSESATVSPTASIGANAVIEPEAVIGDGVIIGAGSVVGVRSKVGASTRLTSNVTLYHDVTVGERCLFESGAVIGSNGFGFANEKGVWHRIAQIGGVEIGDDVEIGANTTVDRGALEPTRIGNGVKLDNLVQIGHNVQIGDHTAMAAMVGIAGSTSIGRHCVFGGASGVSGHLRIADGVQLTGMTMVTHNIRKGGVYSSGISADENRKWQKNAVRFRQLDKMARRLRELEKKLFE